MVENTEYKRYTTEQCLQTLFSGRLYKGRDSVLHRDVMLYTSELTKTQVSSEAIIYKIKKGSQLSNERFMHILDIEVDTELITIILMPGHGRFLEDELETHSFTLKEILVLIRELGYSLLEAASQGISGFSLSAANVWIQEHNQPTLINYWDSDNKRWRGSSGLSRLLYQLIVRSRQVPDEWEVVRTQLIAALHGDADANSAGLSQWMESAFHDKITLPLLLEGLNELIRPNADQENVAPFVIPTPQAVEPPAKERIPERDDGSKQEAIKDYANERVKQVIQQRSLNQQQTNAPSAEPRKIAGLTKKKWIIGSAVLCFLLAAELLAVHMLRKPDSELNQPKDTSASISQNTPQSPDPATAPVPPEETKPTAPAPSGNEETVNVPDLKGMSQKEAEQQALAIGLRYRYFLEANEQASGTVFKQEPTANQKVAKGSSVTFYVGK